MYTIAYYIEQSSYKYRMEPTLKLLHQLKWLLHCLSIWSSGSAEFGFGRLAVPPKPTKVLDWPSISEQGLMLVQDHGVSGVALQGGFWDAYLVSLQTFTRLLQADPTLTVFVMGFEM